MDEKQKRKYKIARIIISSTIIAILIGLAIYLTIQIYPIFKRIQNDEQYRLEVVEKFQSYGSFSWIIILLLQILQTILAVIPSGPIVIISGMMFHPAVAVILCIVGQTLGAIVVIYLVKLLGYKFIALFIDPEKHKKIKVLDDPKKCGVLIFSYLLIPLLPKDPIAFIVPFTKLKVRHFAIISLVSRLPMTIVSVIFGNSIISGNYLVGIIIGGISALIALLCFIFNNKIVAFIDKITTKAPKEV